MIRNVVAGALDPDVGELDPTAVRGHAGACGLADGRGRRSYILCRSYVLWLYVYEEWTEGSFGGWIVGVLIDDAVDLAGSPWRTDLTAENFRIT